MGFKTENELYTTISKNIKYYRKKANITQVDLAFRCNISLSYLTKIEAPNCPKSISLAVLNSISNILNIEITALFKKAEDSL